MQRSIRAALPRPSAPRGHGALPERCDRGTSTWPDNDSRPSSYASPGRSARLDGGACNEVQPARFPEPVHPLLITCLLGDEHEPLTLKSISRRMPDHQGMADLKIKGDGMRTKRQLFAAIAAATAAATLLGACSSGGGQAASPAPTSTANLK